MADPATDKQTDRYTIKLMYVKLMPKIASATEQHMLTQCIALSKDPSSCQLDGLSLFGAKKFQQYYMLF